MKSFLSLILLVLLTSLQNGYAFEFQSMECEDVKSGSVAFTTGQSNITIFVDDFSDELSFTTTTEDSDNFTFTYVVTDADGKILGIPPGNTVDFNPAGIGACNVYGLAYTGELTISVDDNLLAVDDYSTECSDLSDNNITVNRIAPVDAENVFFASSNTSGMIGTYSIIPGNGIVASTFSSNAVDADGIYYDENNDVLYQLNRTDNVINAYSNVLSSLANGETPELTATSSSDFANGREIAYVNGKLIVAQDGNDGNGGNKFIIYNASATSITLDKIIDTDINLWGIVANGNTLFAIEDNSSNVAIFEDFLSQSGSVSPTMSVSVEGLVRTHGIVYDPETDMMLLTDVGDAASATDGALVRVKKFTTAAQDGMISTAEQIRVSGGSSLLGNPVDLAYDKVNQRVYVAERARNGGMILCFKLPVASGGIAPTYAQGFAGASAVYLPGLEVDPCTDISAGLVSLTTGGTSTTIIVDGNADNISFKTTANTDFTSFTYVVTDADGMILGIPPGNTVDFDPAGIGACLVYGVSYVGALNIEVGDDFLADGIDISTICSDVSDNFITVNRIAPQPANIQFYASSNTSGMVGVFNQLEDGSVVMTSFPSAGEDADGIYYDQANDVLYQLNRTDNVINAYSDVLTSLNAGNDPTMTATSSSDFSNGREIAFGNGKIIVAQDGNDDNGGNKLLIYNASATSITLGKVYDVDINLWGIHLEGTTLFAIEDNSSNVATYANFFDNDEGAVTATSIASVEGLVRTHGITYIPETDMMLLTDVGDAGSATDGAIIRIKKYTSVSSDGVISAMEQIRVSGGSSLLGNPVDIAYDRTSQIVYVAERARNGGLILGYALPSATGGIAPSYVKEMAGASAIHFPGNGMPPCEGLTAGTVSLADGGTETTIFVDGIADMISFNSAGASSNANFTYVVTDSDGMILGIPPGNTVDFDPAGLGTCLVYGVSYFGNLNIEMGDDFNADGLEISDVCFDVSDNFLSIARIEPMQSNVQFYASSNTSEMIGVFSKFDNNDIIMSSFPSAGEDADGIFYNEVSDVLYQLNRSDNVINAYSDVRTSLAAGNTPMVTATSSSDFSNGREIAFGNGKIIVAQDGNDSNGGNKLLVYNASATSITLDKVYDVDINLWGIHLEGTTLYAIEDNSSNVATYENFFDNDEGAITATSIASIEGLVRTHGLTYIPETDMMLLTDVGDAGSATDGAIVRVKNYTSASSDGVVSSMEQIRVAGGSSLLGNPVDIAYDRTGQMVYVAERARNGGMILGFNLPVASGGIAPSYKKAMAGASAIHFPGNGASPCENVDGGMVSLATGGTETTIIVDGIADMISFNSTGASTSTQFTYVVTDSEGMILGVPPANTVDFDPAGLGTCIVYGLSYVGTLNIEMGDDFLEDGLEISSDCWDVSSNSLIINRVDGGMANLRFYSSSNTSGEIGVFSIFDDESIAMGSFASAAMDADGIYYDEDSDVLYQLNRTDNRIDLYDAVQESLNNGIIPTLLTSSTSNFSNGREIAVIDGKLIVAQDANDNNDGNKLVVYDITSTSITYDKEYTVDINLWGIFATGNTLFAIEDNSSNVAVFSDFFNMPAGPLTPTNLVMVEDMVRTHGLAYDFHEDMLILTDIGDAASDENDGAIVVIRNFGEVSADGVVSADEQARAFGGSSQLANPVDITLDKPGKMVYVAERKKNGGMIYGFKLPKLTGGIAPEYAKGVPGASAVHLPGLEVGICEIADGGVIALATGGEEATIFIDDEEDMIEFATSVPSDPVGFNFTYVVTDSDGMILGIPPGNIVEFNGAGLGTCYVYGLSYLGDLNISKGDDLFADGLMISTGCSDLSDNRLTIFRIEFEAGVNSLFVSSNTDGRQAAFSILANNALIPGFFETSAVDADGLSFDSEKNVLYQLSRTDNNVSAYSGVDAFFSVGADPEVTATSTSDFSNGREITRMGEKLVVAQDASDSNDGNKFIIYDANAIGITLDKVLEADINLWGIFMDGSTLYAVQDNSSNIAIYDNFLANPAGPISPTRLISVESLVRTHGITYNEEEDKMILTDVGDADSGTDGAIVIINNWSDAIANDTIKDDEQMRIAGDTTLLGNPVDVAYDAFGSRIYIAERKNNGGRILGFDMSDIGSGEYKPAYIYNFAGASAVEVSVPQPVLRDITTTDRGLTANVNLLYPNPASVNINLSLESVVDMSTQVQILDMTGRIVKSEFISIGKGQNTINLNIENLSSGFHVVNIPAIEYREKFLKIK